MHGMRIKRKISCDDLTYQKSYSRFFLSLELGILLFFGFLNTSLNELDLRTDLFHKGDSMSRFEPTTLHVPAYLHRHSGSFTFSVIDDTLKLNST